MKIPFTKLTLLLLLLVSVQSFAATTAPEPPADLTAPPPEAERLPSGLISLRVTSGTAAQSPVAGDVVRVRYTVWTPEGKRLDNVSGNQAAAMAVDTMLPGWREAMLTMVPGEKRRLWLTPELSKRGPKTPETGYVIETELLEIIPIPKTPADVAAPPADAIVSKSGLASKVLRAGNGTEHPKASSQVRVHYTGWTTDGKMFDSSFLHGAPAELGLKGVIRGWTEGIPLMVAGEQRRFWIPANLAYGKDPSKPQGMLVFDVELIDFK
ncbi:MAG: FKBP-type peptidyl-prolyl cis-trans isomerase [Thermoanaerobaculia bacterium]